MSEESRGFRFLEHMTDAEIEAYGENLDEGFANAGRAVEDLMVDLKSIRQIEARKIDLEEKDLGALLYDWIEALISLQESEGLLFSEISCRVSKKPEGGYLLHADLKGEKFDPKRHEQKTAIKAPTFHDMKIEETSRVTLRFLVDL
jgi:SHS2 domain-containing protein